MKPEERTALLRDRTELLVSLFGNRQYEPSEANQSHVAGFSGVLLNAWISNAHAREGLLNQHPSLRATLYERHLGTDMVELVFSALMQRVRVNHYHCP